MQEILQRRTHFWQLSLSLHATRELPFQPLPTAAVHPPHMSAPVHSLLTHLPAHLSAPLSFHSETSLVHLCKRLHPSRLALPQHSLPISLKGTSGIEALLGGPLPSDVGYSAEPVSKSVLLMLSGQW